MITMMAQKMTLRMVPTRMSPGENLYSNQRFLPSLHLLDASSLSPVPILSDVGYAHG
jgi:hypothetical protein